MCYRELTHDCVYACVCDVCMCMCGVCMLVGVAYMCV